jgi:hypothetical protein
MIKKILWSSLFVVVGVWLWIANSGNNVENIDDTKSDIEVIESGVSEVKTVLVIDGGDEVATYSAQIEENANVLEVLTNIASINGITYEVEHYDFGDLVVAIDNKVNTSEKSWVYFVNGLAGDVGAGIKEVSVGDVIEWRYIKPIY